MKDNFSTQSDNYAKYRPGYPPAFFDYLFKILSHKQVAWDCGTGNGQVAAVLANVFDQVFATDISSSQLQHAIPAANISYSVQPAEATNFPNKQFDLIVIAQAIHWFDFEKFYAEVRRTAKDHAIICVLGYGRAEVSPEIDAMITDFYHYVIGKYWDKERRYIDDNYRTIPFPFAEIAAPNFDNKLEWTLEHFIGYLETWSAVKHFTKENGFNPVDYLKNELDELWGEEEIREVKFPLLLRIGRVH